MTSEQPIDPTIGEFQSIIDKWLETREAIDKIKESMEPFEKLRYELEGQIQKMFEATGLEKFQGTKGGVQKIIKEYMNQPPEEQREEFVKGLIAAGELLNVITFHQGRLTSWAKAQIEEHGFGYQIPGLGEMKQRTELRKTK